MESFEGFTEELIGCYAHAFFYATERSALPTGGVQFSQLPLVVIRPAEIVAVTGGGNLRMTIALDLVAMKNCLSASDDEISAVYKTIREDFILLVTMLKLDGRVVDVEELTVKIVDDKRTPRLCVAADVHVELVVGAEFDCGDQVVS
ncbi:MAG: hypothetical protein SNG14_08720 [Rikenellaceae bacterium]